MRAMIHNAINGIIPEIALSNPFVILRGIQQFGIERK
jgi:hypothetical protein